MCYGSAHEVSDGRPYGDTVTAPKRIQMSRQHPWRADNPDAVIVDRRSRWGNPYSIVTTRNGSFDVMLGDWFCGQSTGLEMAREMAVRRFRVAVENHHHGLSAVDIRSALAGKDLACWCPTSQPCHADVLLELANGVAR